MKKFFAIVLILASVLMLCACNDNSPVQGQENTKHEGKIIAQGEGFNVTELKGEDGVVKYSYEIKSLDGEVLEHALCAEQPKIARVSEYLLGMRFTANSHSFSRYYDIENGRVSESFMNAFWDNGELVASNNYDNGHHFLVQSIFGDEFYGQTEIESSSWNITVLAAELNEDGTALLVSYVPGDGSANVEDISTVELPIVPQEEVENSQKND